MTNGMSTPEFLGIFLAAAASVSSVLFMMIGYQTAKLRHFRMMRQYLRLAGLLSIVSWVVMLAVMFRCEHVCWVVKHKPLAPAAIEISTESQYSVRTPGGTQMKWSVSNAGLSSIVGRSGRSSGSGRFVGSGG